MRSLRAKRRAAVAQAVADQLLGRNEEPTIIEVMFRWVPDTDSRGRAVGGATVAVMLNMPELGYKVTAYTDVGGHFSVYPEEIISSSKPARKYEREQLKAALERLGYVVIERRRRSTRAARASLHINQEN